MKFFLFYSPTCGYLKAVLVAYFLWFGLAHAQSSTNSSAPVIEAFGARFAAASPAPVSQARVLVYRQGAGALPGPVNIYLDGRFLTSLMGGGYMEFCAAPGRMVFHAVYDDAARQHLGKQGPGQPWAVVAGKTLVLKVNEATGQSASLSELALDQAQAGLSGTALQIHTISRAPLALACQEPAPVVAVAQPMLLTPVAVPAAPASPQVSRQYALEADALFEFGKTELKASGFNAIELMAQRLKRDYSQVERIRVVGHTDAIGEERRNQRLSLARAEVVADQLRDRGVKPMRGFQLEGQGALSLVKTTCGNKPTPANKQCHAPNRRVAIVVFGARR